MRDRKVWGAETTCNLCFACDRGNDVCAFLAEKMSYINTNCKVHLIVIMLAIAYHNDPERQHHYWWVHQDLSSNSLRNTRPCSNGKKDGGRRGDMVWSKESNALWSYYKEERGARGMRKDWKKRSDCWKIYIRPRTKDGSNKLPHAPISSSKL